MKNSSQILKFINFAGNTAVYSNGTNMKVMYDILAAEFVPGGDSLHANRLSLNTDKTCHMILTKKSLQRRN